MAKVTEEETNQRFQALCDRIGQPWAEGPWCAKPGDWYIRKVDKYWSICKCISDTENIPIVGDDGVLHRWAFHHAMGVVEAFLDKNSKEDWGVIRDRK